MCSSFARTRPSGSSPKISVEKFSVLTRLGQTGLVISQKPSTEPEEALSALYVSRLKAKQLR